MATSYHPHGNPPRTGDTPQKSAAVTDVRPSGGKMKIKPGIVSRIKGAKNRRTKVPKPSELSRANTPKKWAALMRKYRLSGAVAAILRRRKQQG